MNAFLHLTCITNSAAEGLICAEVRLEIKQEAALEREAFDAALEVSNQYESYGLSNFRVNIVIKDQQGKSADSLFFVKINSKEGINAVDGTGIIQPVSAANIHWLIIPSSGAGGINPLGIAYSVKADISYNLNGIPQTISTFEDYITIKPQPALKLEYLLPFEVFGDEPLTETIEPVEPFPLGVRITNIGHGPANNFQINSGQPEIVENKQGLSIDFKLLGTYLNDKKIPDTLLIPFGNIAAGGVKQAAWIMSTSLSGRFIKFDASFSHAAELGGQLTSLVQAATTYTLIKDVIVDLPGRDTQFDFLVNTTTPRGIIEDLLAQGQVISPDLILESDQAEPIRINNIPGEIVGELNGSNATVRLRFTQSFGSNLWVFSSVEAPLNGKAKLVSAVRQDGKIINPANIWLSKHFSKISQTYSYRLNILDFNPQPFAEYTLNYSRQSLDIAPAAVSLHSALVPKGGAAKLFWNATGEDDLFGAIIGGRYMIASSTHSADISSPVSAQINFSTNTNPDASQSYVVTGLAGNSSYYFKLWTQDTGGNLSGGSNLAEVYVVPNPPLNLSVAIISSSALTVNWSAGNNFLPVNYGVWLASEPNGAPVIFSPFKDSFDRSFIFDGLKPDTTYFIYGAAKNTDNNSVSETVYLASACTLPAPVVPVAVSGFTPSSGPIGVPFNISGTGFGVKKLTGFKVLFGTKEAPVTSWTDAKIAGTIPGVSTGTWLVTIKQQFVSSATTVSAGNFEAVLPEIFDVIPYSGPIGIKFTLLGKNFGAWAGTIRNQVLFEGATVPISSWGDTKITGTVPGFLEPGQHPLWVRRTTTDGGLMESATAQFELVEMAPLSMIPSSGPIGIPITITGSNFGAYDGATTRLWVAGSTVPVTSWTDIKVTAKIPGLDLGTYPVEIERLQGNLTDRIFVGSFTVTPLTISSMTPLSGPLGTVVTLTGPGFGSYDSAYTKVVFAGSTVPVSSWSDSKVTFEVPGGYAGAQEIKLRRTTLNGGLSESQIMSFNLTGLSPSGLSPSSGPIGIPLTIIGANFGAWSGVETRVWIAGSTVPVSSWSDLKVTAKLPGLDIGEYPIELERIQSGVSDRVFVGSFTVTPLVTSSATPESGPLGTIVSLIGPGFGAYDSAYTKVVFAGSTVPVSSWSDSKVTFKIPGGYSGAQEIKLRRTTINGGISESQVVSFNCVTLAPVSVSPTSGPIGLTVTIAGTNFGVWSGADTRVWIAGSTVPVSSWADTKITAKIPGLGVGEYPLELERLQSAVSERVFVGTYTVTPIIISSLTPAGGPIGTAFTLTGTGFGLRDGNWTQVLLNGTTTQLSAWSDTKIIAKVPGNIAIGSYPLYIERRTLDGGVQASQAQTFEVRTPVITAIAPNTGKAGAEIILTGSDFGAYGGTALSRVIIGGLSAAISSWTSTRIKCFAPVSLATGEQTVQIELVQPGGISRSNTLNFIL